MRRIAYMLAILSVIALVFVQQKKKSRTEKEAAQLEFPNKLHLPGSGCTVQIKARNREELPLTLELVESSVRVEYGNWNSLYYNIGGGPLCEQARLQLRQSSARNSCKCHFALDCSIPRQYRFRFTQISREGSEESYQLFFPSDSTFTTQNDIVLNLEAGQATRI